MNILDGNRIIWKLAKGAPEWYILSIVIYQIMNPSLIGLKTFLLLVAIGCTNSILKNLLFKPLYKFTGKDHLPIIGQGSRPVGSIDCSGIANDILGKKKTEIPKSFGMPSGHSQIAWTLTTLIILQLFDKGNEITVGNYDIGSELTLTNVRRRLLRFAYKIKYEITTMLLLYSILVSFSRVYVEGCHTIEQVIIGMIFGLIFGYIGYYVIHKYIHQKN